MELRILAHFSEDPSLLKAFQEGIDIHRQTAAVVFGIHPELVSPEMRRQAKVVNFGIIYGMSAFGLAKQLGVNNRMANEFIQRYFARHTRVKAYLEETLEAGPGAGLGDHPAGAPAPDPPDQQQQPHRPPGGGAQRHQYPSPGDRGGYHQKSHAGSGRGLASSRAVRPDAAPAP